VYDDKKKLFVIKQEAQSATVEIPRVGGRQYAVTVIQGNRFWYQLKAHV